MLIYLGPPLTDPTAVSLQRGADTFARQRPNLRIQHRAPGDVSLDAFQRELIEIRALAPDGVIVYVATPELASAADEAFRDSSIPLTTFGPVEGSEARCGHVFIDLADAAEKLAGALDDVAGDARSFGLVSSECRGGWHARAAKRFLAETRLHTQLRCLDRQECCESPMMARGLIDNIMRQYPAVPLLVTLEPSAWLEQPARPLPDGIRWATIGTMPELWPALVEGQAVALAGPVYPEISAAAVQAASDWLLSGRRAPAGRVFSSELVTRSNLESFRQRFDVAAGMRGAPSAKGSD